MSKQRLSRSESQEQTRQSIVESATRLFMAEGFRATSLEQIAADAGFTVGAIYSNFSGKLEIGIAVVDGLYQHAAERVLIAVRETAGQDMEAGLDAVWLALEPQLGSQQWAQLEMEVAAQGSQDATFRAAMAARAANFRALGQIMMVQWYASAGLTLPADMESRILALSGLVLGLGIQRAMDPSIPLEVFRQTLRNSVKALVLAKTALAS